jgi:hypothetical protein
MTLEDIRRIVIFSGLAFSLTPTAHSMQLLSIEHVKLTSKQYVSGYKIKTWGLKIRAVCHLPPGWIIPTGSYASPDGIF